MSKKVCHIISGYYRNDPRIFQRMCKSLLNNGYIVSILTNDNGINEIRDNIFIYSCDKKWNSRFKILLFAKYQFKKRALDINADIYHLHSPELLSLGLFLKKHGKVVFYDAHEDLPMHVLEKDWLPKVFRPFISMIINIYMNNILKQYDEITTPHRHVKEKLKNINANVTEITNFAKLIDRSSFKYEEYLNRENNVCYSGTVYLHSNQESILKAVNITSVNQYQIAGFIDSNYHQQLKVNDTFDKLKFIGRLEWEDLINFYNTNVIGIVIIDYKLNLGGKTGTNAVNKIFEYMEAGLPVICSNYIIWEEMINKHNCGIFVEPGNTNQLVNAINFLLDNKNIAYMMGQNGRKAIQIEYNWNAEELKYLHIILKYNK